MRLRRILLVALLLAACAGADLRLDPSPSCSYRDGPTDVADAGAAYTGPVSELVLGARHGCVMLDERDARCWGGNDMDQLSGRYDPPPGEGLTYDDWRGEARLAAGGAHTCAVSQRAVSCWGNNGAGQIVASAEPQSGIVDVAAGTERAAFVAAGLLHTCVAGEVTVRCWGHNGMGQLGRTTDTECCNEPGDVPSAWSEGGPLGLAAGAHHTCLLVGDVVAEETAGRIYCWGDDRFGALGDREPGGSRPEAVLVPLDAMASTVTAGAHHTCALLTDDRVFCWGRGASGELGDGSGRDSAIPVHVPLPFAPISLVAGGRSELSLDDAGELRVGDGVGRTCAVADDGAAWCWGDNDAGQLGDGTTTDRLVPTRVLGDAVFRSVVPGGEATCGITDGDAILCWGDGSSGQTGSAVGSSTVPVATTVFDL